MAQLTTTWLLDTRSEANVTTLLIVMWLGEYKFEVDEPQQPRLAHAFAPIKKGESQPTGMKRLSPFGDCFSRFAGVRIPTDMSSTLATCGVPDVRLETAHAFPPKSTTTTPKFRSQCTA